MEGSKQTPGGGWGDPLGELGVGRVCSRDPIFFFERDISISTTLLWGKIFRLEKKFGERT